MMSKCCDKKYGWLYIKLEKLPLIAGNPYAMNKPVFARKLLWIYLLPVIAFCAIVSCNNDGPMQTSLISNPGIVKKTTLAPVVVTEIKPAGAATILSRKQIPILCYHQLRSWRPTDSKVAKDYIVPVENFREQLKLLADNGYKTILPDELFAYLNSGRPVPEKSVMLTFDDTDLSQYTVALPEMNKYGFKGVFFLMTVTIGRPGYMNSEQIKELSNQGHVIGSHTWDHQNVKKLKEEDWVTQIEKPTKKIESITSKPVRYFAYPFGLWNVEAIPQLKKRGFIAAFQLSEKRDTTDPLFTIRRMIVPGTWNTQTMQKWMEVNF